MDQSTNYFDMHGKNNIISVLHSYTCLLSIVFSTIVSTATSTLLDALGVVNLLKIVADKLGAYLRNELVMVGQVGAAVHTAVAAMARVQVGLERLGLCQLHHD